MNADRFFNVIALIVGVALVTTLVAHKNTSKVIGAAGSAFNGSLRAATDRSSYAGYGTRTVRTPSGANDGSNILR
jgi:hypothetical protein